MPTVLVSLGVTPFFRKSRHVCMKHHHRSLKATVINPFRRLAADVHIAHTQQMAANARSASADQRGAAPNPVIAVRATFNKMRDGTQQGFETVFASALGTIKRDVSKEVMFACFSTGRDLFLAAVSTDAAVCSRGPFFKRSRLRRP